MAENPFAGTYTALVTPFREGQVDYEALEKIVKHQIAAGVDGLVPCGTTGESPTLTHYEHDEVIERAIKFANRRVPVMAGTGSNSTDEAVYLSSHAAEAGADGLLVVSPYYNKPTQEGLFQHFSAIARAVTLPIVLYNNPGRCGVEISNDTTRRLRESHDNIVAIKHALGRVDPAAELMQTCDIAVLSGDDPITLPLMSLGAVGVISVISNLAPKAVKRLTQAASDGDFAAAREAHRAFYPLAKGLMSLATNPIPIKAAMATRGWCTEDVRLPLCPLSPDERAKLEALLKECPLE
jgi:4-hydroxy-tetrahydrodipicolinate synthase